jgi:hypothetical protein
VLVAVGRDVLHRVIRLPPLIGHSSRRVGGQHSRAGGMCALLPGVTEGQGLSSIYIKIARDRGDGSYGPYISQAHSLNLP